VRESLVESAIPRPVIDSRFGSLTVGVGEPPRDARAHAARIVALHRRLGNRLGLERVDIGVTLGLRGSAALIFGTLRPCTWRAGSSPTPSNLTAATGAGPGRQRIRRALVVAESRSRCRCS